MTSRTRRRRLVTPLSNPRGVQERILAFGVEGTGKSEAWISIAVEAERTGSDAVFYVIDTDGSAAVSLLAHPELSNTRIFQASDPDGLLIGPDDEQSEHGTWWGAFAEAAKLIRAERPGREDWIIIDRLDRMWEAVQEFWVTNAYGTDMETYWAEVRAEQLEAAKNDKGTERDFGGFSGKRDWVTIKKLYNSAALGLLAGPPCNKFAVCLEKDIFPGGKANQLRGLYGETMPAGESNQGANFWLTVHMKRTPGDEYLLFVRRVKDSSFENPGAVEITDTGFAKGFLKKHWGWE